MKRYLWIVLLFIIASLIIGVIVSMTNENRFKNKLDNVNSFPTTLALAGQLNEYYFEYGYYPSSLDVLNPYYSLPLNDSLVITGFYLILLDPFIDDIKFLKYVPIYCNSESTPGAYILLSRAIDGNMNFERDSISIQEYIKMENQFYNFNDRINNISINSYVTNYLDFLVGEKDFIVLGQNKK